jgi:hypothetical protein
MRLIRDALSRRRTFNELSKLSDRELKDIGLTRSEIRYVVASLPEQATPLRNQLRNWLDRMLGQTGDETYDRLAKSTSLEQLLTRSAETGVRL